MYPSPKETIPGLKSVRGVWTGGGAAADCTHVATDWSRGITSIVYTAATGCYTITFDECGPNLVDFSIHFGQQTGVDPITATVRNGSFSATTKSLVFEVNTAGTLTDLLTTDKLHIHAVFSTNKPDA